MYIQYPTHIRRADGAVIPMDIENADFQEFENWVSLGNTPDRPPEPSHAQLWERAIAEMRRLRQPILDVLDGLQASANALKQEERASSIETAKQGLRDITKLDLSACNTFEEMGVVALARYAVIVSALPADIRNAFKEVTQ